MYKAGTKQTKDKPPLAVLL